MKDDTTIPIGFILQEHRRRNRKFLWFQGRKFPYCLVLWICLCAAIEMLFVAAMSWTGRVTPYHLHKLDQQAAAADREEAAACNLLEVTSECRGDELFQRLFAFGAAVLHRQNARFGKSCSSGRTRRLPRLPELCFCLNELYHWPLLTFATLSVPSQCNHTQEGPEHALFSNLWCR